MIATLWELLSTYIGQLSLAGAFAIVAVNRALHLSNWLREPYNFNGPVDARIFWALYDELPRHLRMLPIEFFDQGRTIQVKVLHIDRKNLVTVSWRTKLRVAFWTAPLLRRLLAPKRGGAA